MATKAVTLKNENGDTIYPVTDASLVNNIFPVGSIYMSATMSTAAQVEAAFGGTWTAWGAGRVPVGVDANDTDFDTVEETGGEKTHTLTISEMPSHHHTIVPPANFSGPLSERHTTGWEKCDKTSQDTSDVGGDGAHNNLQPYITCYMYKRIS